MVHPTACEGLRECGKADIDNSCHWSSNRRFLCLLYAHILACSSVSISQTAWLLLAGAAVYAGVG